MNTFFVPIIHKDILQLDENNSKHAIKVLRLKKGNLIELIDGKGSKAKGKLVQDQPKKAEVQITEIEQFEKPLGLSLAFCPTKNNDRNDWIIEKATEIGVTDFYPIYSQNSERRKWNNERMRKITIAALKQSGNLWLPNIHELSDFKSLIENEFKAYNKLMAHCKKTDKSELKKQININCSQIILIGPEGDFTQEEIDLAESQDFQMVSIGNSILRTETACITAVSLLKLG